MKSLTECQRVKIHICYLCECFSFKDECRVCIFPRKLDQCMKSQTPMYAFNILLQFNFMVRMVDSTCGACTIRQKVLMESDKHKDLYTVLLHKWLGNIVFCINKMKEKRWIIKWASLHVKLHRMQVYLVASCYHIQLKMADQMKSESKSL